MPKGARARSKAEARAEFGAGPKVNSSLKTAGFASQAAQKISYWEWYAPIRGPVNLFLRRTAKCLQLCQI